MAAIIPISALKSNYIWLITKPGVEDCIIVDPGDAAPVLKVLEEKGLRLKAILVTHHHADHTQGIEPLLNRYSVPVYASFKSALPYCDRPVQQDDYLHFPSLDFDLQVLEIPGHTFDHIAYLGSDLIFTCETLFTAGCGRLFEGTAQQLWHALQKLAKLPPDTAIYCGHEYTQSNLRFALKVEPENFIIQQRVAETERLRRLGSPTVPSTLDLEMQTNPFLRCHYPAVQKAVENFCGKTLRDSLEVFTQMRRWKDQFGDGLNK